MEETVLHAVAKLRMAMGFPFIEVAIHFHETDPLSPQLYARVTAFFTSSSHQLTRSIIASCILFIITSFIPASSAYYTTSAQGVMSSIASPASLGSPLITECVLLADDTGLLDPASAVPFAVFFFLLPLVVVGSSSSSSSLA